MRFKKGYYKLSKKESSEMENIFKDSWLELQKTAKKKRIKKYGY